LSTGGARRFGWVNGERQALADTLRVSDPDGPTLDEGWTVRHLLAHLVQREQDPLGATKDLVQRRPPGEEKELGRLVDDARTPAGYEALVDRFLAGPPRWSPFYWVADRMNLLEYVVHHEDVRRGSLGDVAPRTLPDGALEALWGQLPFLGRLRFRPAPVGVTLEWPGHQVQVVKRAEPGVVLRGQPVELALYLTGRREAAEVGVFGDPAAVARFEEWVAAS
jgi:uncharacterized protein (TIGR03085 family)